MVCYVNIYTNAISPPSNDLLEKYSAPPSFVCTNNQQCTPPKETAHRKIAKQRRNRRAVRLLTRRYTLTATGYKFLEIRINVGPPSYMEIALGDHRGQELILSLETWKALYKQRWNIYKCYKTITKTIL
ncbi:hypothetical protein P5V15_001151 [Pogonomyrmex californicus]